MGESATVQLQDWGREKPLNYETLSSEPENKNSHSETLANIDST